MTPLELYRPHGLSATNLCDQLWCERQLEFSLQFGREQTPAMAAGGERHQELEEELVELVEVSPVTRADALALKLDTLILGVVQLSKENITRELPLMSVLGGLFIRGVADELRIVDNRVVISDHKTRTSERPVTQAQLKTAQFQLMVYHQLLSSMHEGALTPEGLLKLHDLKKSAKISKPFIDELKSKNLRIEPSLDKLTRITFSLLKKMPPLHDQLTLNYELQGSRKLLKEVSFPFNKDFFETNLKSCLEYWQGNRQARTVPQEENWKCGFCKFRDKCTNAPQSP